MYRSLDARGTGTLCLLAADSAKWTASRLIAEDYVVMPGKTVLAIEAKDEREIRRERAAACTCKRVSSGHTWCVNSVHGFPAIAWEFKGWVLN